MSVKPDYERFVRELFDAVRTLTLDARAALIARERRSEYLNDYDHGLTTALAIMYMCTLTYSIDEAKFGLESFDPVAPDFKSTCPPPHSASVGAGNDAEDKPPPAYELYISEVFWLIKSKAIEARQQKEEPDIVWGYEQALVGVLKLMVGFAVACDVDTVNTGMASFDASAEDPLGIETSRK